MNYYKARNLHGKCESRVDVSGGQLKDRASDGQVCAHLSHAQVARPDEQESIEKVSQDDRERPGLLQVSPDSDEETGSDRASNGHQLHMPGSQTTLGLAIRGYCALGSRDGLFIRRRRFVHGGGAVTGFQARRAKGDVPILYHPHCNYRRHRYRRDGLKQQ